MMREADLLMNNVITLEAYQNYNNRQEGRRLCQPPQKAAYSVWPRTDSCLTLRPTAWIPSLVTDERINILWPIGMGSLGAQHDAGAWSRPAA
jgi:hypothetical protein